MARLTWGAPTSRTYEHGLDRGVLYPKNLPGVAWNGLISVAESNSGGEPRPFYIDGFQYQNFTGGSDFSATIEAFSAPREFDACEGTQAAGNGLLIMNQKPQPFGFSYRTKVTNAAHELVGYRVHLVYGCTVTPASRDYRTIAGSANPMTFSWDVSTMAPIFSGRRPTAHLVIETRGLSLYHQKLLDAALYGSLTSDPHLPLPDELAVMMQPNQYRTEWLGDQYNSKSVLYRNDDDVIIETNQAIDPSFELSGGMVPVLSNQILNPSYILNDSYPYVGVPYSVIRRNLVPNSRYWRSETEPKLPFQLIPVNPDEYTRCVVRSNDAPTMDVAYGPTAITPHLEIDYLIPPGDAGGFYGGVPFAFHTAIIDPTKKMSIRVHIRISGINAPKLNRLTFHYYDLNGVPLMVPAIFSSAEPAGQWFRMSGTVTPPTNAHTVKIEYSFSFGTTHPTRTYNIAIAAPMIEYAPSVYSYWDSSTPDNPVGVSTRPEFDPEGNQVASIMTGVRPMGLPETDVQNSKVVSYLLNNANHTGNPLQLMVNSTPTGVVDLGVSPTLDADGLYTQMFTAHNRSNTTLELECSIGYLENGPIQLEPNTVKNIRMIGAPYGALDQFGFSVRSAPIDPQIEVTKVLLLEGAYYGSYFDGYNNLVDGDLQVSWESTPGESVSRAMGTVVTGFVGSNAVGVSSRQRAITGSRALRVVTNGSKAAAVTRSYDTVPGTCTVLITTMVADTEILSDDLTIGGVSLLMGGHVLSGTQFWKLEITSESVTELSLPGPIGSGRSIYYDNLAIVEGSYTGPYFDGDGLYQE